MAKAEQDESECAYDGDRSAQGQMAQFGCRDSQNTIRRAATCRLPG
jgi:hypothetical protein